MRLRTLFTVKLQPVQYVAAGHTAGATLPALKIKTVVICPAVGV